MSKTRVPWWDRLNAALVPYLGPPALGPYNQEPVADAAIKPCPLCGAAMSEHSMDRGEGRPTYLRCPSSSS
jgi:hypothetical protein